MYCKVTSHYTRGGAERLGSEPFKIFANLYLKTSFFVFPPSFPPLPETTTIAFANVDNVVVTATRNPFLSPGSHLMALNSYHHFLLLLTFSPAPTTRKSLRYSPLSGARMVLSLAPAFSPNSSQFALPHSSPVHTFQVHLISTSSTSLPFTPSICRHRLPPPNDADTTASFSFCIAFSPSPARTRSKHLKLTMDLSRY